MAPKGTPAATAARKKESRHDQWWYPRRCEKPGCSETNKDVLMKCSGCHMVMYCCKEHQAEDWKAHKEECKVFKRLNLRSTFYTDEEMLKRCPLRSRAECERNHDDNVRLERGPCCALCGKDDRQEDMTRTSCCGQVICDNSDRYQLMSYSREFCERSHARYTLCRYHGVEARCDMNKDWRECPGCVKHSDANEVADMLWRGLNSYNFCPLLSKDVPRHARCETCAKCKRKFIMGCEGGSFNADGKVCLGCAY